MKNARLIILIGITMVINLITITSCTSSNEMIKEDNFLYMEEVYAYAKKYYSESNWIECSKWYDKLEAEYPKNPYMDESLFMRGYIYKTYIQDTTKAEKYFNTLILNYPGSSFASSAEFELKYINDPDFVPNFEK